MGADLAFNHGGNAVKKSRENFSFGQRCPIFVEVNASTRLSLDRAKRRASRRTLRLLLATILGVCAWDDSSDLHWEPRARAIAANHAPAGVTAIVEHAAR